jgi:hypothetical protein
LYVNDQTGFGLGVVDISTPIASVKWISDIPIPGGLTFYVSCNIYKDGFISLAPDDEYGNLNVVYVRTKNQS